ncbi:MAG TPA: ABC transporter ATP-binding protein [Acidimicrobiia bacterium]|nr:ABC transporter ATP-binding protein [Acidimicrobiia bacterium]
MALLEVSGLRAGYGRLPVIFGIDLTVEEGEIIALLGLNGAGKTTTLRAISGMIPVMAGAVRFGGEDITGQPAERITRRGLLHVPEGRGIFPNLTVQENLDLGAYLRRDTEGIAAEQEKSFGLFPVLKERRNQLAGTLSGGEQQMLAIARALLSRPQLLLLDEPSLGLAPQVTETIFRTLREVNAMGMSILLVEQNAHLALGLAHYGYVLETGKVVMEGNGRALLASPEVQAAYGVGASAPGAASR